MAARKGAAVKTQTAKATAPVSPTSENGYDTQYDAGGKYPKGPQIAMWGDKSILVAHAVEPEDEFQTMYLGLANKDGTIIPPPYDLKKLDALVQENNALGPCIEAMVTNIEGTGYTFVRRDGATIGDGDKEPIRKLTEMFNQIWPGKTFTSIRKDKRRDEETIGNAYFEVVRNAQDKIIFLRHVDGKMMRLVNLDEAIPVTKKVIRDGVEIPTTMMQRERRYAQWVGKGQYIYFKEYGSSRDVNKKTGKWGEQGQRLPAPDRGGEIIHFKALPDATGPYGVPRWVNQMPSVLGSRQAEEFNMAYFDNGGVPPVMIIVEGGTMNHTTRNAIEAKTSGKAKQVQRVQVIETEPTGGSIDSTNNVKVKVERFGSERQSDSMFEKYDDKCEVRVRRSFRLPPIFVGQSSDYSFATAYTSYTVTEAQVFRPERDEFDEVISLLISDMGFKDYKLQSKPLSIEDVTNKLKGIELAQATFHVEPEDIIEEINTATGTDLKFSSTPVLPPQLPMEGGPNFGVQSNGKGKPKPGAANHNGTPRGNNAAYSKAEDIINLAVTLKNAVATQKTEDILTCAEALTGMDHEQKASFHTILAALQFTNTDSDREGLAKLSACTLSVLAGASQAAE